ncbi:MAG: hypothetical protein CMJ31_10400 [Phycisphaerae bacterium]|nr:hypothetical protein [Phycisphaerae bacterium]|tara:strand:- start:161 stop:844 length:684 start_codon:yes stop_codon:yes gene_type:complete
MIRTAFVLTSLAALSTASAGVGGNLLGNAGFEDGTLFDVNAMENTGNWVAFFGGPEGVVLQSFQNTGATPFAGAAALETSIEGSGAGDGIGANAFTGQVQFVDGVVGDGTYTFSIWARNNGSALNGGAEFRIEWFDAGGAIIGDQFGLNMDITSQLTDQYQLFSITADAPTNAAGLNAVFAVQSFANDGTASDIAVAWDNASVTLVPAPAGVALLGLGGFAATRRRR